MSKLALLLANAAIGVSVRVSFAAVPQVQVEEVEGGDLETGAVSLSPPDHAIQVDTDGPSRMDTPSSGSRWPPLC